MVLSIYDLDTRTLQIQRASELLRLEVSGNALLQSSDSIPLVMSVTGQGEKHCRSLNGIRKFITEITKACT